MCSDGTVKPLCIIGTGNKIANILILSSDSSKGSIDHAVPIQNLEQMLRPKGGNTRDRAVYCRACLTRFPLRRKEKKDFMHAVKHQTDCFHKAWTGELQDPKQDIEIPKPKDRLKFRQVRGRVLSPLVGFADFESVLKKMNPVPCKICKAISPCTHRKSLEKESHHALSIHFVMLDRESKILESENFIQQDPEDDVGERFLIHLLSREKYYKVSFFLCEKTIPI